MEYFGAFCGDRTRFAVVMLSAALKLTGVLHRFRFQDAPTDSIAPSFSQQPTLLPSLAPSLYVNTENERSEEYFWLD